MDYDSLKQEIFRLYFDVGLNQVKVTEQVEHLMEGGSLVQKYERVRKFIQKERKRRGKPNDVVKQEKIAKVAIYENLEPVVIKSGWKKENTIRFGLVSDTHFNSKYAQITHLHDFYDILKREGITNVYHAGDVDEGEQMRPGHQYECYTQGADEHVDEIVRIYPKRDGIVTSFITGNHDASTLKRSGHDMGRAISRERKDMIYLGQDNALVMLTPNCSMLLTHPWAGSSYAISYRPQKMIDAMPGGEKPNILVIGHYHKSEFLPYRNIACFQAGTFQAQTPFMRGKSLAAMMGGWIIEVDVDEEGSIKRVRQDWFPYYNAVKDDWKNWRG